jgi:hypothetical protein
MTVRKRRDLQQHPPEVRQFTGTLPYFHEEVPVLCLRDGTPYIPIQALCRILGLRAERYLPTWRKSLVWASTRKLPLQTPCRGRRIVWCLHFGALPLWYTMFPWKQVIPERHEQLQQASQDLLHLPERTYHDMLVHYQRLRRALFWFLTTYANAQDFLKQVTQQMYPILNEQEAAWWKELMTNGETLILEATAVAQKMLHEQEKIPSIDAWHLNQYGEVVKSFSLPLLPCVPDTMPFSV